MYLHIIAFNVPYPANYGGVIDVFFKIKALTNLGVKVILHTFEYGRPRARALGEFCEKIYYYRRDTSIFNQLSFLPFIVKSRNAKALLKNIIQDDHPILFEGLHTCYFLHHPTIKHRKKLIRMHNVEWQYYAHLAKMERHFFKKIYFTVESLRLKAFERRVRYADAILSISNSDTHYFRENYSEITTRYIPAFHVNEKVTSKVGTGNYLLFHGDLSVKDNEAAAFYILENLTQSSDYQWIIAGLHPSPQLRAKILERANVILKANLPHEEMDNLIQNAHANVLLSFQSAGMKLKLLNALFRGRFCVVNGFMVKNTGLEKLCRIGNTPSELIDILKRLATQNFSKKEIEKREAILTEGFSNQRSAEQIVQIIGDD
ncbi:MAG: glycosyltransferase [Bacteroidota bacterium]